MPLPPENAGHILVVDDEPAIARLLEQILVRSGYQVTLARDGHEALERVAERTPELVLLDLDMPRQDGFETCRRIKENPATQLLPVIIITGRGAGEARLRAWELGADEFLTKPFQLADVLARCRSLLRIKRLVDDLDTAHSVVYAFARAVEAKCPHTLGHAERVTDYALALGDRVDLSGHDREILRQGAILHDIGKISTPDAILNKPGALTLAEFEVVKQHPLQGARILEPLRSIRAVVPLVRGHHERMDGGGYPDGLFGGSISLLTRILSVADVYDALGSPRPYRPALPAGHCLEVLRTNAAAGGLDPKLVECFAETVATTRAKTPEEPLRLAEG